MAQIFFGTSASGPQSLVHFDLEVWLSEQRPKRVWVFYGGSSKEREVSLRSGAGVVNALGSLSYEVRGFDVAPGNGMLALPWHEKPDLVFLALHGTWGEDGGVQGFLESLQIPYTGCGVLSSALSFHKSQAKRILRAHNIPVPDSYEIDGLESWKDFQKTHRLEDLAKRKWFLKPSREGSTIGIERFSGGSTQDFVEAVARVQKFDSSFLIEEWVDGPEITVPVLAGQAMPAVEIRPLSHFYDYESKYTKGKTEYLCPATLPKDILAAAGALAERVFEALECADYGRVDMMIHAERGPLVLEMNTLPGMTETSLVPKSAVAAGWSYAEFLDRAIVSAWSRHMRRG